jgi:hypothetical protein
VSDLSGALIIRWIVWINLFDFNIKYVPGKKHAVADGLSQQLGTEKEQDKKDINKFINSELDIVWVAFLTLLILRPCVALLCPVELRAGEIREGAEEVGEENLAVLRYSEIRDNKEEEWKESKEELLRPGYSKELVKLVRWLRTL